MIFSSEQETTVSIKDLAPGSEKLLSGEEKTNNQDVKNNDVVNDSYKGLHLCLPNKITRQKSIVHNPYIIIDSY